MRNKLLVVLLCLILFLGGCSPDVYEQVNGLTAEQKLEDFEHLFHTIIENYPFLGVNKRLNGVDWKAKHSYFVDKIANTSTNEEFFNSLSSILMDLNNSHTHMLEQDMVINLWESYYHLINQIGEETWFMNNFNALNDPRVIKRYGLEELELKEVKEGESESKVIEQHPNAQVQSIIQGKVGYIKIPRMVPPRYREKDEKLIREFLFEIQSYQALVIDIRGNTGGDSGYWIDFLVPKIVDRIYKFETYYFLNRGDIARRFIDFHIKNTPTLNINRKDMLETEALPNLPNEVFEKFGNYYINYTMIIEPAIDSIGFSGNIYLLVDRFVFSSAEMFAAFAKETGFATLVGETTGGDGLGTNPWLEVLPNSGFVARFPILMGTTSNGTVNEEFKTVPHYKVDNPRQTFLLSSDRAIRKILEIEGLNN